MIVTSNCSSDTLCDSIIAVITETQNEFIALDVKVYPNPFTDYTFFSISKNLIKQEDLIITVFDLHGRAIRRISNITSNGYTFDRTNLASGIYFYQLSKKSQILFTGKLIVQ